MRSRPVLLVAAGLHMATETALAPFYPALFRSAFDVQDLTATGFFIACTRTAAIIAIPLWGLATRRWRIERLVLLGQSAAVVLTTLLSLAPTYAIFTTIGVALVAVKTVVLLAYPKIARTHPAGLVPGVRQYVAMLQAAVAAAAGLGTLIISVPQPQQALPMLALVEAGLLAACVAAFRGTATSMTAPDPPAQNAALRLRALLPLALLVLGFALAGAVVRPYFAEYAAESGFSEGAAALLFVLAHLAALAVCARTASPGLISPLILAATGLALQAVSTDVFLLALGRIAFGAGLGLGQVALDVRVLSATRGSGAVYGLVASAQHTGLLSAPLIAMAGATRDLALPLISGAALFALLAIVAAINTAISNRSLPMEVSDVPLRTR